MTVSKAHSYNPSYSKKVYETTFKKPLIPIALLCLSALGLYFFLKKAAQPSVTQTPTVQPTPETVDTNSTSHPTQQTPALTPPPVELIQDAEIEEGYVRPPDPITREMLIDANNPTPPVFPKLFILNVLNNLPEKIPDFQECKSTPIFNIANQDCHKLEVASSQDPLKVIAQNPRLRFEQSNQTMLPPYLLTHFFIDKEPVLLAYNLFNWERELGCFEEANKVVLLYRDESTIPKLLKDKPIIQERLLKAIQASKGYKRFDMEKPSTLFRKKEQISPQELQAIEDCKDYYENQDDFLASLYNTTFPLVGKVYKRFDYSKKGERPRKQILFCYDSAKPKTYFLIHNSNIHALPKSFFEAISEAISDSL